MIRQSLIKNSKFYVVLRKMVEEFFYLIYQYTATLTRVTGRPVDTYPACNLCKFVRRQLTVHLARPLSGYGAFRGEISTKSLKSELSNLEIPLNDHVPATTPATLHPWARVFAHMRARSICTESRAKCAELLGVTRVTRPHSQKRTPLQVRPVAECNVRGVRVLVCVLGV